MLKKKLTKRDKARQAALRAAQLKQQQELERQRLIQEQKERLEAQRKAALEKEAQDNLEHDLRVIQLDISCKFISELHQKYLKDERKDMEQEQWDEFLLCDGLPNPSNCGQMNTYLHLWDKVKNDAILSDSIKRTEEVLHLLDLLENFIECPAATSKERKEWLTVSHSFKKKQQENLDHAAYVLLTNIHKHMKKDGIKTSHFVHVDKNFTLCIWVLMQLPVPQFNPKKPKRPRQELKFEELGMHVVFPERIDVWSLCVRAMYVAYDHFSYRSRSFKDPEIPSMLKLNLKEVTDIEWEERMDLKAELSSKEEEPKDPEELLLSGIDDESVVVKEEEVQRGVSALYIAKEDDWYKDMKTKLMTNVSEFEVNLRKYTIIGGVFFIDLLNQPPQPITLALENITVSTLQLPKWLSYVNFVEEYNRPPPPAPGVTRLPEEIEAELKKQEQEMEKFIFVTLDLPKSVLWLDVPIVCNWNEEKKIWSTEYVHDVKHNEEKQMITFRTGKFGIFAMAMFRYCSMPYQAWEMKPGPDSKVIFTIMAAVLIIEFTICDDTICISQLQNAPNDALDSIIGKYFKLQKLKRILRTGGIDVFPGLDAICYTKGVSEKHWSLENHLYYNMAQCSLYYNFAWSRWNLLAGRRKIIMQMREWTTTERTKQPNYNMLMVTPLKALLVDCTEVSPSFIEEGISSMKYYSDLYHLAIGSQPGTLKNKIEQTPSKLVNTVANILNDTRVMSFS